VVAVTEQPDAPADQRRVVAVVVTFNRLELVQTLVARLDEVPELAEILVVDNASSDGTGEWLAGLDDRDVGDERPTTPVLGRTLAENTGGAGGFHDGLAWAMERGAELVWLMDDDGLPDVDCLTELLAHGAGLDFWGPLVVSEDDGNRLVFPIRLPGTARILRTVPDAERAAVPAPLINDVVIPFNGVLVTRALVEEIGLPRAEFFIWGDDVEYLWRAQRVGARVATVASAVVRHPSVGELGTAMLFGRTTYNHSPSDLKHYCMARNNLVNLRDFRGWPGALAFVAKTVWFYGFTRPSVARLRLSARGMYAGLRGDFTGHRAFLR
jgi:rhamnopyranosyl-N-acetylglucosaminyl-diphospho-decaprenol beta-1,3/1,4-galactofuranosyltransferase